jgi:predicted nucleic acid-binding protein
MIEDLDDAVPADDFQREALPDEAGFLAGKAFLAYRRRGGQKRAPLPDFYIGAHSAVRGYQLLTRDATRYRTYFPTITLIAPEAGRSHRSVSTKQGVVSQSMADGTNTISDGP